MNNTPTPPTLPHPNQKPIRAKWGWIGAGLIVGVLLSTWLALTPPGLLGKADAIGYAVCHRIDVRSFHLGDRPISLCARCTGQYLGAVLALVFLTLLYPKRGGWPSWSVIGVLGILAFSWGFDGLNSFASLMPGAPNLYTPNNTLRLFTGMGFGLSMGMASFIAFNQVAWRKWRHDPVIANFHMFGILLICGALLAFFVLTENPLFLYPLSLISASGVIILLTIIYTVVVLTLFRKENQANNLKDLLLPLLAGFGIALLQIALLDLVRFWITGTWEGFHIVLG